MVILSNNTSTDLPKQCLLPRSAAFAYVTLAAVATVICLLALFAIVRTKRTVYSTKILSSGLLVYNISFLISSSIPKFFDPEHMYMFQHLARGFHVSAWIIVGSMALDRLWAINWPYSYLQIASKRRTRLVCGAVFILCLLQYFIVRGAACYATNMIRDCGKGFKVYLMVLFVVMPIISFVSYGKVYTIIKQNKEQIRKRHRLTDFKGTLVSFLYLINTAICSVVYFATGIYVFVKMANNNDGRLGAFTDFVYIFSCLADPLIYVVYFREARLEIYKLCLICFPQIQPKLTQMKIEIFSIPTYLPKAHKMCCDVNSCEAECCRIKCPSFNFNKRSVKPSLTNLQSTEYSNC